MTREKIYLVLLFLLVGVVLIFYGEFQEDLAAAELRIAEGLRASTPCGDLEYAERGDGPAVLMIHGAGGGFDQGLFYGADLTAKGFRVIAVSRFGYLGTPLPEDFSPEVQADAHACLLDALNLERVAVVGGSAGAPSAVQLVLRHPERVERLALLVPVLATPATAGRPAVPLAPETEALIELGLRSEFLYWTLQRLLPGLLIETVLATPFVTVQQAEASEQQRIADALMHILPIEPRRDGIGADRDIIATLPAYPLELIDIPTLIFSAGQDRFGAQRMARHAAARIPGATLVEFPDGGHLWVGHHQTLMDRLGEFLRAVQTTSGPSHSDDVSYVTDS